MTGESKKIPTFTDPYCSNQIQFINKDIVKLDGEFHKYIEKTIYQPLLIRINSEYLEYTNAIKFDIEKNLHLTHIHSMGFFPTFKFIGYFYVERYLTFNSGIYAVFESTLLKRTLQENVIEQLGR